VKLTLCLTKHYAMVTYWGTEGIAPRIFNLGIGWRFVVSFTAPAKELPSPNPSGRRLGGPQIRSGEEKKSHHYA